MEKLQPCVQDACRPLVSVRYFGTRADRAGERGETVKVSKRRTEKYTAGIDRALHRAVQQAAKTAAATGTRLVIYENGRIKRVRPRIILDTIETRHQGGSEISGQELSDREEARGRIRRSSLRPQRTRREPAAVSEKRTKYGSE